MGSRIQLVATLFAALSFSSCGGGGAPSTPSAPTPSSIQQIVTINIVGSTGNQAFRPNPAQAATGAAVVWKNDDSTQHRIVMDDGSGDSGMISPGSSSSQMTIRSAGGNYHCTIHPSMVGSINGASAPEPPPGSGGGY